MAGPRTKVEPRDSGGFRVGLRARLQDSAWKHWTAQYGELGSIGFIASGKRGRHPSFQTETAVASKLAPEWTRPRR